MNVIQKKMQDRGDDIISQKSLDVVKILIHFLKEHARVEGLFRRAGRREVRRHILNSLKKGHKPHFENSNNVALECAAALQIFLSRLKKPIMPQHVQELILADNPGVEAQVIAQDALGLIRQDVGGRHCELLTHVLDLLRHLTLSGPPSECSELRGSPLPVALLPVFFNLSPSDLIRWKQVAARFSELITEAAAQLRRDVQHGIYTETINSMTNYIDVTLVRWHVFLLHRYNTRSLEGYIRQLLILIKNFITIVQMCKVFLDANYCIYIVIILFM
ncbi:PREDICTED: uncharacterized protein LOC105152709 [Acromyrmex echinatior]|uniref:uncharacterized protein LOC105152709 n=1 Tax=Acromyrmex echinatior TaxID=103372 RepID=UPI0005810AE9|nr:PREDICTED: uncharacterized protein LOC105152709 [Acromyrmex echinatior]